MTRRRGAKKERNAFYQVAMGAMISAAVLLVLTLISSIIINMTSDPLGASGIASLCTLLLSAALSGFMLARRAAEAKMLRTSLSSLLFCLLLFIIGIAISGGELSGRVFMNYVCYMGVALLFGKLGASGRKRTRRAHAH